MDTNHEYLTTDVSKDVIANAVADEYGVLYSKDGKRLYCCWSREWAHAVAAWADSDEGTDDDFSFFRICKNGVNRYVIKEGTEVICNNAFSVGSCLREIIIPNSVTTIGELAFFGCTGLTEVTIPNSVTTILEDAFSNCTGLTSVFIGNSVTSIGYGAFSECTELTDVTIHNSATTIGQEAFRGCSKLNVIRIVCSQNEESFVLEKFKKLLPEELHDIISIEYEEQLPSNKTNKVTYAELTECETLVVSETDDLYANEIADKLGVNRVDYDIPSETRDEIDWEYPVVKYPQYGCVVFPYRNRSIARMGYMEPLFMDYLHETFDGCGLQIVGDCSILPRDGQRPYEPDIAIMPDEYPSIRIDVEIDEPYAAVTNKPIHYIGCGDDFRDMNLNNLGWIVIRFTEYQVYSDMKGCAAFIAQVLHDIQPRMSLPAYLLSYPGPETVERWQEIEAKVMAIERYREKYLKHEFKESEERKYTTADVTQTEEEREIARKVSPLNITPFIIDPTAELPTEQRQPQVTNSPNEPLVIPITDRDSYIQFNPYEHIYLFNGREQFKSVSELISYFFEPFLAYKIAEIHVRKYGGTEGEILEKWDMAGCMASEAGTFMHKQIENVYNGLEYQKVYHFRYNGKYLHADTEISLEQERHHFMNFKKDHDFKPYRTEWAIYDEGLKIAGTIDMIHKRGEVFDIYDWKRSGKIVDEEGAPVTIGFRGKSGINGLESVQDTAYWHYCIQQNLYRYILERNYGITVGKMYLVVMIATMDNYIKLEVPRMNEAIEVIVEKCRNGFIEFMDGELPF